MIIVVLLCAIAFYAVLYLAWEMSQTRLTGVEAWMRALNDMVWMPENLVFLIFRGLIVVTMFYVIADWLVSSARKLKRHNAERREKQQQGKPQLGLKKPPGRS
jgi:uncharacterized metal-binding protein